MSGQSEKQSTVIRYCRPAWEQKSAATSWNGLVGRGLTMIGSRWFEVRVSWQFLHDSMVLSMSLSIPGQ